MRTRARLALLLSGGLVAASGSAAFGQRSESARQADLDLRTLLVHLPSAPVKAANRQAEAITSLAEYLSQQLPEWGVEAKIFRRWGDAQSFLEGSADRVSMMMSDASFAFDLPAGLSPAYRFVRDGRETYRRSLVVRSDRREFEKLADLSQKSLAVVETAGAGDLAFLRQEVFEGDLDPAAWFTALKPEADDFSATASVLYGQTDAALIAEYNPLLKGHLGKELRVVFESPALSLPVLSVREAAFTSGERQALDQAITGLGGDPLGRQILADLGIEELRSVAGRGAVLRLAARDDKRLEIAAPTGSEVILALPPLPAPGELSFGIVMELPEIPLPSAADG